MVKRTFLVASESWFSSYFSAFASSVFCLCTLWLSAKLIAYLIDSSELLRVLASLTWTVGLMISISTPPSFSASSMAFLALASFLAALLLALSLFLLILLY